MSASVERSTRRGLVAALALVVLAVAVPLLTGWSVRATSHFPHTVAPLHATWHPVVGLGTPLLILIGWRFRIKPPGLFALYVAFYTFGRTFEELLRIGSQAWMTGTDRHAFSALEDRAHFLHVEDGRIRAPG